MPGSATCKHSGTRARGLGRLGNRGAQTAQPVGRARSAAAPPSPPRLPGSLRSPPAGPNTTAQCVQIPEGAQGLAAGSAGSRAPPPLLRRQRLVQPAPVPSRESGGAACRAGGYLTAVSRAAAPADRREGGKPQGTVEDWRTVAGWASSQLPPPGAAPEAGASRLLLPGKQECAYVCTAHGVPGKACWRLCTGRGTAGLSTPVPRPGLALDPFSQIILSLRTRRGTGRGRRSTGAQIRRGPQGPFGHMQPVHFTDSET